MKDAIAFNKMINDGNDIKNYITSKEKELEDKYGAINIDLSDGSYVLLEQD